MDPLFTSLQQAVAGIADRVGPAVVGLGRGWARGSGVVVAPGRVLTAAHALRGDRVGVAFADGRTAEGRVAGADADLDIGVVEVDTGEIAPVEWDGSPSAVSIGSVVFALANPGGHGLRVT